jgi:hypothetical protein
MDSKEGGRRLLLALLREGASGCRMANSKGELPFDWELAITIPNNSKKRVSKKEGLISSIEIIFCFDGDR